MCLSGGGARGDKSMKKEKKKKKQFRSTPTKSLLSVLLRFLESNSATYRTSSSWSKKKYNTLGSTVVTDPSTDKARRCLASVIEQERALSSLYGRT